MLRSTIAVAAFLCGPGIARAGSPLIVGYYPSWMSATLPHTAVRYDLVTHLAHAFIFPNANGTLDMSGFSLYPELVQAAHDHGVKVVISVGGWDAVRTPRFSTIAADSALRAGFVANLTAFCRTNGYDGADIDWEYPKTAADRDNYTLLLHALSVAFDAEDPRLSLSIAGPAGWWGGQWFDVPAIKGDLDWIGMMTYDFYGAWTPKAGPNSALYAEASNTEGWVDNSVSYYQGTRGVAPSKLLIGVPFYGQQFNASALYGASTAAVQVTYRNIAPKLSQGWTRTWNTTGRYPYLVNSGATQVITYDDSASVAEKARYAVDHALGGVMIWALGQDEISGSQPLLESLVRELRSVVGVPAGVERSIPSSPELLQNYPNPFNPETRIRYRIATAGPATLTLFDLLGREVATLASGTHDAGEYETILNARQLSAGMYVYRLTSAGSNASKKCIVLP